MQVKLLRVLQERQVRPLGSNQAYHTDTRFLAASNRNLKECSEQGTFRADLYYRLNVITIQVPPLRERGGDIVRLAEHFMRQFVRKFGSPVERMSPDFIAFLNSYHWPGNVRELQNVIERAVILADTDELTAGELEESIVSTAPAAVLQGGDAAGGPLSIEDYIKDVVLRYQESCSESKLAAMPMPKSSVRLLAPRRSALSFGKVSTSCPAAVTASRQTARRSRFERSKVARNPSPMNFRICPLLSRTGRAINSR